MTYRTFFIQADKAGNGLTLHVDTRWTVRIDDIYIFSDIENYSKA